MKKMIFYNPSFYSKCLLYCFFLLGICPAATFSEPISPVALSKPGNPGEISLGKQLFNSDRLSRDNSISCASCHNLSEGGDDGLVVSVGIDGQEGTVNAPTVFNSGFNAFYFWDGRATSLEEQVAGPIHNPVEMGSDWQSVLKKLARDKSMVEQFNRVYKDGLNARNIARAIAAYQRQLVTEESPFDQYLKGDDSAIDEQAKSGYQLFRQMGCISCHQGRNIGVNMFQHFGIMGDYFQDRGGIRQSDYGRYNVTGNAEDRFKFKVPSLRNIEQTAPYFHDGSAKTLEEAIRVMARYQLGRPISADQVAKIKAFLQALTGQVREDLL